MTYHQPHQANISQTWLGWFPKHAIKSEQAACDVWHVRWLMRPHIKPGWPVNMQIFRSHYLPATATIFVWLAAALSSLQHELFWNCVSAAPSNFYKWALKTPQIKQNLYLAHLWDMHTIYVQEKNGWHVKICSTFLFFFLSYSKQFYSKQHRNLHNIMQAILKPTIHFFMHCPQVFLTLQVFFKYSLMLLKVKI